jgi:hypothetical protein
MPNRFGYRSIRVSKRARQMTTRTWAGGSGLWTDQTQWTGGVAPLPGDAEVVAAGTVSIPGGGSLDAADVLLGAPVSDAAAVLFASGTSFGSNFTIDSTGNAANATFAIDGGAGYFGVIDADAAGGTFTISTTAKGTSPGELVLLDFAALEVSNTDTIVLDGTVANHASITINDGGTFVNNGTIAQADGVSVVESGGTLTGSGTFEIGLYSSLYFEAGAAPSAQAVRFTDVGARLFLADPANYTGQISNFQQGDLIDLTATIANAASYDASTDTLTVTDNGSAVATLDVAGLAGDALTVESDGSSGTLIEVSGTVTRTTYTIAGDDRAMKADVVRDTMTTASGTAITGTGVKIGIISNSFDVALDGVSDPALVAAQDGYLPYDSSTDTCAVTVLQDGSNGSDDEGLAMAEEVYQVAPGAQLYFDTAGDSASSLASAITALQNEGCNVIVDDYTFYDEPFFQVAGPVDDAIESALDAGVSYFTAAGNFGDASYQATYTPQSVTLHNGTTTEAEIFSNGTPYQTVTLLGGVTTTIALQWAVPYGSSSNTLSMQLFDMNGNLIASSQAVSGGPAEATLTYTPNETTQYQLAIEGSLASGTTFKYVLFGSENGGSTAGGTIDDPAADNAGTVIGHAMVPGVNAVGAIDFADTPVFGASDYYTDAYSASGPAELFFDASGNALTTPEVESEPAFIAPVGSATTDSDIAPFYGTSSAAPNAAAVAALMLQADPSLTPAQITAMLEESADDLGLSADQQGAGLIQADAAVKLALEAACYAAGTAIATERGEVMVQQLRLGDRVRLAGGGTAPVVWLGHRGVECRRHPRPWDVWPVRVRAGAFGERQPQRDLILSPDHAVFTGGVLIPVRYLINGATVVQEKAASVEYWHVELDRHNVILAEGLPCESYLDTGNRAAFANGGALVHMHPDFALRVWAAEACAALVLDGPRLTVAKRDLLARAAVLGHAMTDDPGLCVLAGGRVLAAETDGRRWCVRLPAVSGNVRLLSRVWSPAQMRPASDDTRSLGVAIARLWLDRREVSLESPGLAAGWHAPEPDWRWTDGDARLALAGVRELAFEVAMTGSYWCETMRKARKARGFAPSTPTKGAAFGIHL